MLVIKVPNQPRWINLSHVISFELDFNNDVAHLTLPNSEVVTITGKERVKGIYISLKESHI